MTSSRSAFRRDWAQSIGASGVSFALTLVSTPIMTRLFDPHEYGAYGILNNASVFIVGFGLLGLPNALAGEFARREQRRLFVASSQLAIACFALVTIAVVLLMLGAPSWLGPEMPGLIPLLLPILVLCTSVQQIGDCVAAARGWLPALVAGRLTNAFVSRAITIGIGWLAFPTVAVMVLGDGFGKTVQAAFTLRGAGRLLRRPARILVFRPRLFRTVLESYRDFVLYSNVATVLPVMIALGVQLRISGTYTLGETGWFVLAQSIITLPTSLIAGATAHVVFRHLGVAFNEHPSQLFGLTLKTTLAYSAMGVAMMVPILLFGPQLFAFFFGERWKAAGEFAAILAVPQILAFSLTAQLSIFRITRRLRLWFGLELASAAVVLGIFYIAIPQTSVHDAVWVLAALLTLRHILLHLGCLYVAHEARSISTPLEYLMVEEKKPL